MMQSREVNLSGPDHKMLNGGFRPNINWRLIKAIRNIGDSIQWGQVEAESGRQILASALS